MASVAIYPVANDAEYQPAGSGYRDTDWWNGPDEWGYEDRPWGAASRDAAPARPSQCQVRTFPNEDILFWMKPEIDNSRVVRQEDPGALTNCWKGFSAAAAVVVLAVGLLLPKALGLIGGMELEQLRKRNAELRESDRIARLEEGRVTSPEQVEKLAIEFGFKPPSAEHLVRLNDLDQPEDATRNAVNR